MQSIGSGALYVLEIINTHFGPDIDCKHVFPSNGDPLYDLCWSDCHPNIIWTVSANGFIQVWDLSNTSIDIPIHVMRGHEREIYAINWSPNTCDSQHVLTVSSDSTVKVWDVLTTQLVNTFLGHESIVYSGQWSPFIPQTFATTSGDSTLKLWSLKQSQPLINIRVSLGMYRLNDRQLIETNSLSTTQAKSCRAIGINSITS